MMRRLHRRWRSHRQDNGFVAIEFVFGLGFLMLPVALLLLVFPTWSERQAMARVAAREAARTYVLTADAARAQAVVSQIAENHKLTGDDLTLTLEGNPAERGGSIRATVQVQVPILVIGIFDEGGIGGFSFTEAHTEVVDRYRSRVTP